MLELRPLALLIALAFMAAACSSQGEANGVSGDNVATNDEIESAAEEFVDESTGIDVPELEEISGAGGAAVLPADEEPEPEPARSAVETAAALGRGINFGNALDAPREGDWGVSLEAADFTRIAEAGFDHVRLPVSWEGYAAEAPPYTITSGDDPTVTHPDYDNIWERVDWAIDQADANDLMLILNMHHYDEAHVDPAAHADRIAAMWAQIAERYSNASRDVVFELFNEPNGAFTEEPQLWNDLAARLVDVVRETNPTRTLLAGPVGFNHVSELDTLELPDDPNLIATVHVYEPFDFTHQGADWIADLPPLGVPWSADQVGLADGFRDLSWDTTSTGDAGALRVDYSRQWAGFSVGSTSSLTPSIVSFTARSDEPTTIQVGCQQPGNTHVEVERIDLTADNTDFTVDMSACSDGAIGVGVLNANPSPVPVRFTSIEVCSAETSCEEAISSSDAALRGWLRQAAQWGDANDVPVHLGEFGSFGADGEVPIADRQAWTATLVDEASDLGIPFSYWEYNSGFGAYDQEQNQWVPELLTALVG